MLELKNITKKYKTGDLIQTALDGVSLNFRENEFVSILGPSGSGKTTLLNIIGGLDKYDTGDLIINNVSTKKYKNKDWDSYRNHSIGFVFQSYNLIPHQTILANVELALTISGVGKSKRRKMALNALDKVGLKEQAHKKPNQMSGGQMQRVAIARALVNNPNIVLADEPTGALDTVTSVQIMELLKEVAKDRLVIMVTHNPDLAQEYSTRIVNLKDGKITGDSNPFEEKKERRSKAVHKNLGKASMSVLTAFSLSLNNLLTKKARTILTSFAGSIGIIGIALILSVSTGFQNYIDKIQEDALTSYPLTLTSETADTTSILLSMVNTEKEEQENNGKVVENQNVANMFSSIGKNDLKSFKKYLESNKEKTDEMVSFISYQYGVIPQIYTIDVNDKLVKLNPSDFMSSMMPSTTSMNPTVSNMSIYTELIDNDKMVNDIYEVITGRFPEKYDELVLMLPDENHISDLLLYSLGLKDIDELNDMLTKIMKGEKIEAKEESLEFTYEELMNTKLKLINPSDTYKYNESYNIYESMSDDEDYMRDLYNRSTDLKIVGIIRIKDTDNMSSFMSGVGYTSELKKYMISQAKESEIVKRQLSNKDINVFSNKEFGEDDNTGLDFNDLISIDTDMLSSAFNVKINEDDISQMTQDYMQEISEAINADTSNAKNKFLNNLNTLTTNMLNEYIDENGTAGIATIKAEDVENIVSSYLEKDEANLILQEMENEYVIPKDTFKTMYSEYIKGFLQSYVAMASMAMQQNMPENDQNQSGSAMIVKQTVNQLVTAFVSSDEIAGTVDTIAQKMVEANMQKTILSKVGELVAKLMGSMADAFNVDQDKIAAAFKFNLSENEVKRLFNALTNTDKTDADSNLMQLGYQDLDNPSIIALYFKDFDSKEKFIDFLDEYNEKMQEEDEEKVIQYTDITGVLISSVKVIVDSVSYVLIAFVSISLVVSSIMIGIITYISVLERTKEIGILRAIGASKRNISSIFNAETFIIGLFAGLIGIGMSELLLIPINSIIHTLTGNENITAVLPINGAIILVILSVILTLIGGLIPSKKAAKKDPVLALRTE